MSCSYPWRCRPVNGSTGCSLIVSSITTKSASGSTIFSTQAVKMPELVAPTPLFTNVWPLCGKVALMNSERR